MRETVSFPADSLMHSRRTSLHFAVGLSAVLFFACSRSKTDGSTTTSPAQANPSSEDAAQAKRETTPSWPRTVTYEGVEMIELFPQHATESSPLIVVIHGRGDHPKHWVEGWRGFPARAQIVLPRAFDAFGEGGWSWFELRDGMTAEELGKSVGDSETKLWRAIEKVAGPTRKNTKNIIVTGFSQGGMLSYVMASRHPDAILRSFPIAGFCPKPLLPEGKAAPVSAFHGTEDTILKVHAGRDTVSAFKAKGNEAEMREYMGVGHTITKEMRHDWWSAILKVVPEQ